MRITDELRKWSKRYDNHWIDPKTGEMTAIYGECQPSERFSVNEGEKMRELLDEIEREHECEVTMTRGEAVAKLGNKVAREYVKLPVDADGKPIHVGDKVYYGDDPEGHWHAGFLTLYEVGWAVDNCMPVALHHLEAPTVEDVLREFSDEVRRCCDTEETIAEYADLIRKAVEYEEDK